MRKRKLRGPSVVPRKTHCVGETAFHPCWSGPRTPPQLQSPPLFKTGVWGSGLLSPPGSSGLSLLSFGLFLRLPRSVDHTTPVQGDGVSWFLRITGETTRLPGHGEWKAWLCRYRNSVWRLPREAWVHPTALSLY